jgi:hypothetical protein
MRVHVESVLECDANRVWSALTQVGTLQSISWPLITIAPHGGEALPDRWKEGATFRIRAFLWNCIPLGARSIHFERIDDASMTIQTREQDPLVRTWDHRMQVVPLDGDLCRYSDDIEIRGGPWTVFVWAFAQLYYGHRHRHWKQLARKPQEA